MEAIVDRQVRQYQVSEYEKGQRATDYTTWLTSDVHYNAKFEEVRITPPQYCCSSARFSGATFAKGRAIPPGRHLYVIATETCAYFGTDLIHRLL